MKTTIVVLLAVVFLVGCAGQQTQEVVTTPPPEPDQQQVEAPKPASDNKVNEPTPEPEPAPPVIEEDVAELLAKADEKVQSIFYRYKGPESEEEVWEVYQTTTHLKYHPLIGDSVGENDLWDVIYLDIQAQSAESHCEHRKCVTKGKYQNENYAEVDFPTPFDWLEGITEAEKVGEQQFDRRDTWKLETNKGTLWVDTFFGVVLQAETSTGKYTYNEIDVNGLSNSEVQP